LGCVGSFYSAHHVGVICLTQTTRERTGVFFFLASCFCPPLESSSELWPAWGKGKGTAREQGKSILGSQLAHLRRQLGKWPWGCCCIGVLRPWRQKLDGSSGRPWNHDSAGGGGRGDTGGAHLAFGRSEEGSQEQINEGSDFSLGKRLSSARDWNMGVEWIGALWWLWVCLSSGGRSVLAGKNLRCAAVRVDALTVQAWTRSSVLLAMLPDESRHVRQHSE
jgi:hypothetical protein